MNSREKVYEALEQLADADDDELREALPIPIPAAILRGVVPAIARNIPEDVRELDAFLTQVGDFCHAMRSDGYAVAAA